MCVCVCVCFFVCLLQSSSMNSVVISSMIIVAYKIELIISSVIEKFLFRCMCLYFLLYFCVLNTLLHDSTPHFSVASKEPSTSNYTNMNVHCRTVFSLLDKNNVYLIGQCFPVCPLRVNVGLLQDPFAINASFLGGFLCFRRILVNCSCLISLHICGHY